MRASVPGLEVFQLNSRVISAIYYHAPTRRMVVQTAHGKFLIYTGIDKDIPAAIVGHPAPGMLFEQGLRAALKPRMAARMSLSNLFLLRRVRALARLKPEMQQICPTE